MSMSIEDLRRKAEVYREIIKTIPAESVDREGYVKTLASIESEIASAEQPTIEEVRKDIPEEVATAPLPGTVEQTEELVLPPKRKEEAAPVTQSKGRVQEPEKVSEGAVENQYVKMLVAGLIKVLNVLNTPVFGEKKTKNGN